MYLQKEIERLIDIAVAEDIGSGDITSEALIPEDATISAQFVLKQAGVLAGLPFLEMIFQKINSNVHVAVCVEEGSYQKAGTIIAKITGSARAILAGERVALNFIQHASGVATVANEYVRKIKELNCIILDTRKTLPGLRALEKYAVKIGGGQNHRFSLDGHFTIKSNHLYFVAMQSQTPIQDAAKKTKQEHPNLTLEIEISNPEHISSALETEADVIILSRMTPRDIKKCVTVIRKTNKKIYLESLGTITLDTVRAYAETGVDGISIGSLTHSVPALDIVMRLKTR